MFSQNVHKKIVDIRFKIHYATIFKIKTWARRNIVRFLKLNRPASYPYITGDGFRSLAEHVYDESMTVKIDSVRPNDIIFVRSDFLMTFFQKIHPEIQSPYILISHNSDDNIDSKYEQYIDEKIIHWFAQNALITHKKITPLPIGLRLRCYDNKNKTIELLKKYKNEVAHTLKIFFGFDVHTNTQVRTAALENLLNNQYAIGAPKKASLEDYYSGVAKHAFNACPQGNGFDCHRTWESLYLETIPIAEKNSATLYWQSIGIPLFLIESWSDLKNIDETRLKEVYEMNRSKLNSEALYMDYWITKIIKYKN